MASEVFDVCIVFASEPAAIKTSENREVSTASIPASNPSKGADSSDFFSGREVLHARSDLGHAEAKTMVSQMNSKPRSGLNQIRAQDQPRCAAKPKVLGLTRPPQAQNVEPREGSTAVADLQATLNGQAGEIGDDILHLVLSMKLPHCARVKESEIAGLNSTKKLIRDKVINPIMRPDLHFGLHRAPRGILLFGPPGTGKTMLAKWMASASGAEFFEVTPSAMISKFHGETETIVRGLFKVAEVMAPSVVFIDEIDALLMKRREKEDDATIRMKNQLLQMMDGFSSDDSKMVVIVGATNRPDMLDEAALRRLPKRVLVPLPDLASRVAQLGMLLGKHETTSGAENFSSENLEELGQQLEGWNGSDVQALCAKAAEASYDEAIEFYGGIEKVPDRSAFRRIEISDFQLALKEVRPSSSLESEAEMRRWASNFGCA